MAVVTVVGICWAGVVGEVFGVYRNTHLLRLALRWRDLQIFEAADGSAMPREVKKVLVLLTHHRLALMVRVKASRRIVVLYLLSFRDGLRNDGARDRATEIARSVGGVRLNTSTASYCSRHATVCEGGPLASLLVGGRAF